MSTPFGGNDRPQGPYHPQDPYYPGQPAPVRPGTPSGGFPAGNPPVDNAPSWNTPAWGAQPWEPPSHPVNFGAAGGGGNAPADNRRRNRRAWLGVFAGVVVVLIALGITGFWKPGFFVTKVFDQSAQQDAVKNILTTTFATPGVESVSCPAKQEVKAGTTFQCTAKISGQDRQVTITVTDSAGNYQVSAPS